MKILLVSDLHFSSRPQDEHFWDLFGILMNYKNKVDEIYILGDLTTAKDNHSALLVNKLVNGLTDLAKTMPVTILRGNHDGINESYPYFEFLNHIPNITYIKEIMDTPKGLFLPHTRDPVKDWQNLKFENKIIFAHMTVNNVIAESMQKLTSSIESSWFDSSTVTFSGDIHKPQELGWKVVYVGSPYTIRFNDNFQGGGIILDTDSIEWERIEFNTMPKRGTLEITDVKDFLEQADYYQANDQLKIRLQLGTNNLSNWRDIKQQVIDECAKLKLTLSSFELLKQDSAPIKTTIERDVFDFDSICEELKINKEYAEIGKEILNKCS